jgi:hypothetical protein
VRLSGGSSCGPLGSPTVVESDIRYPTDLGLAQDAARMLATEGNGPASWPVTMRRG